VRDELLRIQALLEVRQRQIAEVVLIEGVDARVMSLGLQMNDVCLCKQDNLT
jgi:hypothetical protein